MEETKGRKVSSARAWLVVIAAALVMMTPSYAQMQMSPIAGSLMELYDITQAQYMSVFTAPNMLPIFIAFVAGILLDKFGTKRTVLVATAITCIGVVGRVFVAGYVPFYCMSVLMGVATSFMTTGAAKLMAQFFPLDKIGLPVGIIFAGSSLANLIAMSTTAFFPTTFEAFVVAAAVAVIAVLFWAFAVPTEKEAGAVKEEKAQGQSLGTLLKDVLTSKDTWMVVIASACLGVIGFAISGMLPTVLATRGMNPTDAGLMASTFALGMLVGCVAMPAITPHIKNEKVFLVISLLIVVILIPFIMLVPFGAPMVILLAVIGFIAYGVVPIFLAFPVRFPKVGVERAGTAGGLITMIQSAAITFLPGMLIMPLAGSDFFVYFAIVAVLAFIALLCAVFIKLPPKTASDEMAPNA